MIKRAARLKTRLHRCGVILGIAALAACSASDLPTSSADLGRAINVDTVFENALLPGPIEFEKVTAAHWSVPLSGLLNLEHPKAVAAQLEDRDEAITIYTYVLAHPVHGVFLVDSGVSERFRIPGNDDVSWIVDKAMNLSALALKTSNRELVQSLSGQAVAGVFLTHIHLDHIMGFADLPDNTPVYLGPGDVEQRSLEHLATRGTTDRFLSRVAHLKVWNFSDSRALDVFGDGSLYAIHTPGHTAGSTVYLARTPEGAHLMLGDLTHTRWGWENGVEPGSYSADMAGSAASLTWIKSLIEHYDPRGEHITVHPGHQSL